MSDTISRQAAIDVADAVWSVTGDKNVAKVWDQIKDLPSVQPVVISKSENTTECEDAVSRADVDTLIEEAQTAWLRGDILLMYPALKKGLQKVPSVTPKQPGWIPCSRELPKPNEEDGNGFHKAYLVQDGRWMDVARWDGKYWVAWGYSTVLLNVVAWCELPIPYREGEPNE